MRKLYSISLRRRLANDDNIKTEYKRKNNIEDKSYSIIEELKWQTVLTILYILYIHIRYKYHEEI